MKKFCDLVWTIRTVQEYERKYECKMVRSHLIRVLEGAFLGGRKTKAQPVLERLLRLQLLEINDEHQLCIMPRGSHLSSAGFQGDYELNTKQKQLLSSWYVPLEQEITKRWLDHFSISHSKKQLAIRSHIPKTLQQWTEEMIYLRVVVQSDDQLELSSAYSWIRAYPQKQQPMTMEELRAILEMQEQSGRKAEEIALYFEKRRLQELGLVELAERVECISNRLVNAGYDILSFSSIEPVQNRFIEVKSVGIDCSFYWSRHELEVAKLLGSQYYLYLVDQTDPIEPTVEIIENPYYYVSLHGQLEPTQYFVSFNKS